MQDSAATLGEKNIKKGSKSNLILPTPDFQKAGIGPEGEHRKEYNDTIKDTILPEYLNFVPNRGIIVRCYVMEYTIKNGMLVNKPDIMIPIPAAQGTVHSKVASPWPYSRKAIVISAPEGHDKYKQFDEVLLAHHVILSMKNGLEADFQLPYGFTTHNHQGFYPPSNYSDPHFGYLIVDPYKEILGKL